MSEAVGWAVAACVGAALGLAHTWGLWWTVQRLRAASSPKLLLAASMAVRTAVTLAGFYLVMSGSATRLALCLAGFVLARGLLTRRLGARPAGGGP
jgi:F1F0 ATPase subunit 2